MVRRWGGGGGWWWCVEIRLCAYFLGKGADFLVRHGFQSGLIRDNAAS